MALHIDDCSHGLNNRTTVWAYCGRVLVTESYLLRISALSNEAGKEVNVALHNLCRITERKSCPIVKRW